MGASQTPPAYCEWRDFMRSRSRSPSRADFSAAGSWLAPGFSSRTVPSACRSLIVVIDFTTLGAKYAGRLHRVPWGSRVSTVAALATSDEGPRVVLLDPSRATCAPGRNVAGEPRDKLTFVEVAVGSEQVAFASSDIPEELFLRGALSRTLLMAGALEAVAELTVSYSAQRHQFGRPIGRFQAVAQRLARLASETEAAALAAGVAVRRFEVAGIEATFEVGRGQDDRGKGGHASGCRRPSDSWRVSACPGSTPFTISPGVCGLGARNGDPRLTGRRSSAARP